MRISPNVSVRLCGSQIGHEVNNDIDRAANASRQVEDRRNPRIPLGWYSVSAIQGTLLYWIAAVQVSPSSGYRFQRQANARKGDRV